MATQMNMTLATHRAWEDWLSALLGVVVILSPLIVMHTATNAVMTNAVVAGVVIVGLTLIEVLNRARPVEVLEFLAGVWLMASVFVLDYSTAGQLRIWHFVLGALVALLAIFEFWQDSVKRA